MYLRFTPRYILCFLLLVILSHQLNVTAQSYFIKATSGCQGWRQFSSAGEGCECQLYAQHWLNEGWLHTGPALVTVTIM